TFSALAKKMEVSGIVKSVRQPFILLTLHRPVNTDDRGTLIKILEELSSIPSQIIWPVHPRNRNHINEIALPANVQITEPFSYFEMLLMLEKCEAVITDSGGLQKETYWAKKPCITLRSETEWVETLSGGWNQLFSLGDS